MFPLKKGSYCHKLYYLQDCDDFSCIFAHICIELPLSLVPQLNTFLVLYFAIVTGAPNIYLCVSICTKCLF